MLDIYLSGVHGVTEKLAFSQQPKQRTEVVSAKKVETKEFLRGWQDSWEGKKSIYGSEVSLDDSS